MKSFIGVQTVSPSDKPWYSRGWVAISKHQSVDRLHRIKAPLVTHIVVVTEGNMGGSYQRILYWVPYDWDQTKRYVTFQHVKTEGQSVDQSNPEIAVQNLLDLSAGQTIELSYGVYRMDEELSEKFVHVLKRIK